MVKRRAVPTNTTRHPTAEAIEAFASGADGGNENQDTKVIKPKKLDPNVKRNFKAIRVPFNEYEYSKLEEAATKTGRTKLNVIRWGILKLVEELNKAPNNH